MASGVTDALSFDDLDLVGGLEGRYDNRRHWSSSLKMRQTDRRRLVRTDITDPLQRHSQTKRASS